MAVDPRREWPAGVRALLPWLALALGWYLSIQIRPLFDPDEGRYAEIPREMLASGDWLTPRYDGLKYFEKPPLQYWGTAGSYAAFGVSDWSSRLWGFSWSFACLPLVYAWTRRLYGREAGLAALAAIGTSPLFVVIGHLNLLDGAFTFWLSATLLAFTLAQCAPRDSRAERGWMLAAWGLAALAVLSKGIVVGVLAGASLAVYSLLARDWTPWRRLHPLTGLALFLAIAAPWFVAVSVRNPGFAQFFFIHEHFARFLTTVHQRVEPWWFFLPLLLGGVLPWIAPLTRALRAAWQAGSPAAAGPAPQPVSGAPFRPLRFLMVYAGVTLVFFSSSGSKLAPYILPMLPVLAALAGACGGATPAGLARSAARIGAGLVLSVAIGLALYSARKNSFVPQAAVVWGSCAVAVALAGVLASTRARAARTAVLAGVLAVALALQCLMCEYACIPPARSARELVRAVRPFITPGMPLYSVGQYRESISPYLGRTLQLAGFEGELRFGLDQEPQLRMSQEQFAARWSAGGAAVAFFDPEVWDAWRRRGLPGHVLAADENTVAVSRL
jgi:4-amino-4-deoxy-L-arabinose transferase-like glycosyltransferase